jgi:hypothetical protein
MLAMMFWPANNIKNLPTISRTSNQQYQEGHEINGSLPINSSES